MRKQKIKKKSNWLVSIYRFFIPKNFMSEVRKGMEIGEQPGQSIGGAVFDLGKKARKTVDPKHEMKFGKDKEEK